MNSKESKVVRILASHFTETFRVDADLKDVSLYDFFSPLRLKKDELPVNLTYGSVYFEKDIGPNTVKLGHRRRKGNPVMWANVSYVNEALIVKVEGGTSVYGQIFVAPVLWLLYFVVFVRDVQYLLSIESILACIVAPAGVYLFSRVALADTVKDFRLAVTKLLDEAELL